MPQNKKKQAVSLLGFDANHIRQTEGYVQAIDALYNSAVNEYAQMAGKLSFDASKLFAFKDYPGTSAKAEAIVNKLAGNMQAVIVSGSSEQWLYACKKNDEFLNSIINTSAVPKATLERWQDKNLDALKAFQSRKVNGMDLSDRIWKYTGQMKTQMELGIDIALGEGKSAAALSRDLRQYLVDPDKLFRRVRDKHGKLVLSKHAKAFHPGQGKYRSSYKNAMRLTRSEINMSYRESDQLRWQQLDFVVGFEVKLSNNHTLNGVPFYDVCDELKGKYPKSFKFKGWHPQCRCHAIPIMQDPDEFNTDELNELKAAINGTEYTPLVSKNTVHDVPEGFKGWIANNAERSKGWISQPYFIRDNFAGGNIAGGLKLATKSAEALAAEKLAVEASKAAAIAAEAEAKAVAEKAAKAKALLDKTTKMSTNIVAKAEKAGFAGSELDDLKALLIKEGVTNAELNSAYKKLKASFKAFTEKPADLLSREFLLTKFSQSEVDSLFAAYNKKIADISHLSTAIKIEKLEFEITWIPGHSRYSTSGTMVELYKRDVQALRTAYESEKAIIEAKRIATDAERLIARLKSIDEPDIKAAIKSLKASIKGETIDAARVTKAIDEANAVAAKYKTQRTAGMPQTLINQEETIDRWMQRNATRIPAEKVEEVKRYMSELMDNGEFSMRFNSADIDGIMQHGFLNQIELRELGYTPKSGGMLNPDRRIDASSNLFGTDKSTAKAFDYEHYGYLGDNDMAVEMKNWGPSQYGKTIAIFKKNQVTATFTMQDSLGSGLAPTLTTSPGISSVSDYAINDVISAGRSVGTSSVNKFTREIGTSYIELQYHGKIDLSHVERIIIASSDKKYLSNQTIEKLKGMGIKLFVETNGGIVPL